MAKVVAGLYISLDGVIESGWTGTSPAISPTDPLTSPYFNDPEVQQAVGSLMADNKAMLKSEIDGQIGVGGSATLVRWLLAEKLLDELHLLVFPLILGGDGARLYHPAQPPSVLKLTSSQALANGVIHLGYVLS